MQIAKKYAKNAVLYLQRLCSGQKAERIFIDWYDIEKLISKDFINFFSLGAGGYSALFHFHTWVSDAITLFSLFH